MQWGRHRTLGLRQRTPKNDTSSLAVYGDPNCNLAMSIGSCNHRTGHVPPDSKTGTPKSTSCSPQSRKRAPTRLVKTRTWCHSRRSRASVEVKVMAGWPPIRSRSFRAMCSLTAEREICAAALLDLCCAVWLVLCAIKDYLRRDFVIEPCSSEEHSRYEVE